MKTVFLDFASLHPQDLDLTAVESSLSSVRTWAATRPDEIVARLADADVAVINKIALPERVLESLPNLKLICLAATGTDNIDLEAATRLGIAVCNIRDYCTPSVVQHVFALILALTQHLVPHRKAIRSGAWQAGEQFCLLEPPFRELQGRTLGLIGLGSLGSGVAGVARAFGMRVIAARLPWRTTLPESDSGQSAPRLPLHEVLQQSDVISLHCPLNDDTRNLIDMTALEQMKRDAILINTARGGLIDAAALVTALEQEEIAGAGIDVLEQEPPPDDDPILSADLPNLIVTPHIAWSARESRQRAVDQILANIIAFGNGGDLNRVY